MSSCIVVSSILLSSDQLLRVKQLTVGSSANLIHDSWFKINEDSSWYMLACSSLRKEGVEGIISTSNGLVRRHLTIRLDSVLQAKGKKSKSYLEIMGNFLIKLLGKLFDDYKLGRIIKIDTNLWLH